MLMSICATAVNRGISGCLTGAIMNIDPIPFHSPVK
jgi:hypothetical protein